MVDWPRSERQEMMVARSSRRAVNWTIDRRFRKKQAIGRTNGRAGGRADERKQVWADERSAERLNGRVAMAEGSSNNLAARRKRTIEYSSLTVFGFA